MGKEPVGSVPRRPTSPIHGQTSMGVERSLKEACPSGHYTMNLLFERRSLFSTSDNFSYTFFIRSVDDSLRIFSPTESGFPRGRRYVGKEGHFRPSMIFSGAPSLSSPVPSAPLSSEWDPRGTRRAQLSRVDHVSAFRSRIFSSRTGTWAPRASSILHVGASRPHDSPSRRRPRQFTAAEAKLNGVFKQVGEKKGTDDSPGTFDGRPSAGRGPKRAEAFI